MATRCITSVDYLNRTASSIYEKHQKRDIYGVAADELKRIAKERKMLINDTKRKRHTSAPANLFERRSRTEKNSITTQESPGRSQQRNSLSTTSNTKSLSQDTTRLQNTSKKRGSKTCKDELPRSKSVEPKSKTQTNRYVKEILNKIECGCFASEWNKFSGAASPVPKWVDFYSGDSGGVLDAFVCNSPDNESNNCYLIDVKAGERVARLLKYPQQIRVGHNGVLCEPERKVKDEIIENKREVKARKNRKKERTLPLSWHEQLEWKDAKVITTTDVRKDTDEAPKDSACSYQVQTFSTNAKRNISGITEKRPSKVNHYKLKMSDFRIQQKIQKSTWRAKPARDFSLNFDPSYGRDITDKSSFRYNLRENTYRGGGRVILHSAKEGGLLPLSLNSSAAKQNDNVRLTKSKTKQGWNKSQDKKQLAGGEKGATAMIPESKVAEVQTNCTCLGNENRNLQRAWADVRTDEQRLLTDNETESGEVISEGSKEKTRCKVENEGIKSPAGISKEGQTRGGMKIKKRVSFEGFDNEMIGMKLEKYNENCDVKSIESCKNVHGYANGVDEDRLHLIQEQEQPDKPKENSCNPKQQLLRLRSTNQASTESETLQLEQDLALLKTS